MNILITNDDGPASYGLVVLKSAVEKALKNTRVITLTPQKAMSGQGMAVTMGQYLDRSAEIVNPPERLDKDTYSMRGRPADIIHFAMRHGEFFAPRLIFDAVIVGVNHGANVGSDIYHSGTVGAAMTAVAQYNTGAFAFSQDMDNVVAGEHNEDAKFFSKSEKWLQRFLQETSFMPGECWNVNFPRVDPKGFESVPVSHYSFWRDPPVEQIPRARAERSDVTFLKQGFVTVSELQLRVNPTVRF